MCAAIKKSILCCTAAILGTYSVLNYFTKAVSKPQIYCSPTPKNEEILSHCHTLKKSYWPTFWCYNQHLSTFVASFRTSPEICYTREAVSLEDGGVLALDWFNDDHSDNKQTMIILPGLNGGSSANYIRQLIYLLKECGWRCVVMNYRGTNGTLLKTPKAYCGAYTEDIRHVCKYVKNRYSNAFLVAAGFSLGSNILVKYLGEEGSTTPLNGAISISNPFDFLESAKVLESRPIYNRVLTAGTVKSFTNFAHLFTEMEGIDKEAILKTTTLRDYDEQFTRKMFGYNSVDDYYRDASSAQYLPNVQVPTLLVNATDDPIVSEQALPLQQCKDNPHKY